MTTKTKASAIKVIADTLATEIGNKYSDEFIKNRIGGLSFTLSNTI